MKLLFFALLVTAFLIALKIPNASALRIGERCRSNQDCYNSTANSHCLFADFPWGEFICRCKKGFLKDLDRDDPGLLVCVPFGKSWANLLQETNMTMRYNATDFQAKELIQNECPSCMDIDSTFNSSHAVGSTLNLKINFTSTNDIIQDDGSDEASVDSFISANSITNVFQNSTSSKNSTLKLITNASIEVPLTRSQPVRRPLLVKHDIGDRTEFLYKWRQVRARLMKPLKVYNNRTANEPKPKRGRRETKLQGAPTDNNYIRDVPRVVAQILIVDDPQSSATNWQEPFRKPLRINHRNFSTVSTRRPIRVNPNGLAKAPSTTPVPMNHKNTAPPKPATHETSTTLSTTTVPPKPATHVTSTTLSTTTVPPKPATHVTSTTLSTTTVPPKPATHVTSTTLSTTTVPPKPATHVTSTTLSTTTVPPKPATHVTSTTLSTTTVPPKPATHETPPTPPRLETSSSPSPKPRNDSTTIFTTTQPIRLKPNTVGTRQSIRPPLRVTTSKAPLSMEESYNASTYIAGQENQTEITYNGESACKNVSGELQSDLSMELTSIASQPNYTPFCVVAIIVLSLTIAILAWKLKLRSNYNGMMFF